MNQGKIQVLVLGAGFGGIKAAKTLAGGLRSRAKEEIAITVINRRNYHLYTPFLYQAATGLVDVDDLAQPIRVKAKNLGFKFIEAEIKSIDIGSQKISCDVGEFSYDYLVIALGSIANREMIEGATEHTTALKTLEDGNRIHNKIISSFEKASLKKEGPEREAQLSFVVIGGSTGVELAGAIRDYTAALQKYYREIDTRKDCKVYVIEAHERLFPNGDRELSNLVKKTLAERGVEVITNTKVASIKEGEVNLPSGRSIRAQNIFFNAGTKPSPVLESIPEQIVSKVKGRLVVDDNLRIPGKQNVYAIGDSALFDSGSHPDHLKPLPATAQTAVEMGEYCGKHLAALLSSEIGSSAKTSTNEESFRYKDKGTMLSVGIHNGIAQLPQVTFTGFAGWLVWRLVHLYLVNTLQGKLRVIFDWTLGSLQKRNITHLD